MFLVEDATTPVETTDKFHEILWDIVNWLSTSGVKLLIGLIILFIGCKIVNLIAKSIRKTMIKRNVDKTITHVTHSVLRKGLKIVLFVCFLGYVGIDTAAFASLFAAIGVGISLAMQGALSNFAGGLVILVTRPFKLGDFVEAQGVSGTVEDIEMFYSYFKTPDNKVIMIPNGTLANGTIINYSLKDTRRVDLLFSVSYDVDFNKAKEVIRNVALANDKVLQSPEPFIRVKEQADSSINITCRLWSKNEDYWDVYFYMMEEVKLAFDREHIDVPYPQLDVHVKDFNNNTK